MEFIFFILTLFVFVKLVLFTFKIFKKTLRFIYNIFINEKSFRPSCTYEEWQEFLKYQENKKRQARTKTYSRSNKSTKFTADNFNYDNDISIILEQIQTLDKSEFKKVYKKLALKFHPDRHQNGAHYMSLINKVKARI